MNQNHWTNEENTAPAANYYRTGSTNPPKARRGLLTFLLVVVILLVGLVSVLGLLNLRLFQQIKTNTNAASFQFIDNSSNETPAVSTDNADDTDTDDSVSLQLQETPQAVENVPQEGGLSLQEIYSKAIDAVVSITCTTSGGTSTGSGVVIAENGYIVTNAHVVNDAHSLQILFNDGATYTARIIGADDLTDLAVLQVDITGLTAAEFGDSASLRVGDTVVAIGDPLGIELRGTMTNGIVSAINRDIVTEGRTMTLIQTNAALNSGNSGGPLLNCYGQVIGINTMKMGDHMSFAGVEGLGFAIPSATVKEIVDQLIAQGYVAGRPELGLTMQAVTVFDQMYYRVPQGLYITKVAEGSSADVLGLQAGDILLTFDGQRLTTPEDLQQLLYNYSAGDTVQIALYRYGKQYTANLTLDEAK